MIRPTFMPDHRGLRVRSGVGVAHRPVASVRLILAFVFLLCFCWQTCLAQAHFHPSSSGTTTAASQDMTRLKSAPAQPDKSDKCPLCRELVHAGHILPGTPPSLTAPVEAPSLTPVPSPTLASIVQRPFLAWYSRGPPQAPSVQ